MSAYNKKVSAKSQTHRHQEPQKQLRKLYGIASINPIETSTRSDGSQITTDFDKLCFTTPLAYSNIKLLVGGHRETMETLNQIALEKVNKINKLKKTGPSSSGKEPIDIDLVKLITPIVENGYFVKINLDKVVIVNHQGHIVNDLLNSIDKEKYICNKKLILWCYTKNYKFTSKFNHNYGELISGWAIHATKIQTCKSW
jgi:hypothetical protein